MLAKKIVAVTLKKVLCRPRRCCRNAQEGLVLAKKIVVVTLKTGVGQEDHFHAQEGAVLARKIVAVTLKKVPCWPRRFLS